MWFSISKLEKNTFKKIVIISSFYVNKQCLSINGNERGLGGVKGLGKKKKKTSGHGQQCVTVRRKVKVENGTWGGNGDKK